MLTQILKRELSALLTIRAEPSDREIWFITCVTKFNSSHLNTFSCAKWDSYCPVGRVSRQSKVSGIIDTMYLILEV